MSDRIVDPLSQIFSALADPTRRAILTQLMEGGASFTELANPHNISRPAVVKHIKALEKAGLVDRTGASTRPTYKLSASGMKMPRDWLNLYESFWEGSYDRVEPHRGDVAQGSSGRA